MTTLRELLERRTAVVTEMRTIADTGEELTPEKEAKFDTLKTELTGLDTRIDRQKLVDDAERRAPAVALAGRLGDGQFEVRAREFSITKAIGAALGEDVDAGFEREISAEVRRRSGRKFQGIAVPDQAFVERRAFGDNVMLSDGGGAAASLYPTAFRPDLFIDRLRAALIVGRLGATVLSDLHGDQDIPRQTSSATAEWIAEDAALTDTALAFDDVLLQPKTVGAITSYSRKTLLNASPDIEALVRNDLAAVIARAIDKAALLGSGTGNTPTGVRHQTGVIPLTLTTPPTWVEVLDFPAAIQMADADIAALGWAMAPDAVKVLRSTLKATGAVAAEFLMEEPGTLAGYTAEMTTALSNAAVSGGFSTMLFGAWSQLLIGYWSGIDLLVNPYADSAYARGRVLIRVMRDCDVAVRHPESFAYGEMDI